MKKHLAKLGFIPLLGIIACSPVEEEQPNTNQQNQQNQQNGDDVYYYRDGRYYGPAGAPYAPARRSGRRAGRRAGRRN